MVEVAVTDSSAAGDRRPEGGPPPRRLLRRFRLTAVAAVLGAGLAGAYAHFFGCNGTCPITSSVWTAALYGAVVGSLVAWPGRHDRRSVKTYQGEPT